MDIPGIKYWDEGSRSKILGNGVYQKANGTRNFVIFPGNEHLLDIQDMNGNPINEAQ